MLAGALLEAISVAVVYPYVSLIGNPGVLDRPGSLRDVATVLHLTNYGTAIMVFSVVVLAFFLVKNGFIAFMYAMQYRLTYASQCRLSSALLKHYLTSPYTFHLSHNSAELLRNIRENALWIFDHVLHPALTIMTEAFILIFIIIVLVMVSPVTTGLTMAVFLILGCIYVFVVREKAEAMGRRQQRCLWKMNLWVNQGLNGIKEVKLHQKEAYVHGKYMEAAREYALANTYIKNVSTMIRPALEAVVMSLLAAGVILLSIKGDTVHDKLPLVALFGMASIKVMPSINRILAALSGIRYHHAALDEVCMAFHDRTGWEEVSHEVDREQLPFQKEIRAVDIGYSYPGSSTPTLRNVSLQIGKGSTVGFAGASGAGKTTLVNILVGLLEPTAGEVRIDGTRISRASLASWQNKIGYIPQSVYLLDASIKQNVAFGLDDSDIDEEKVREVLEAVRLTGLIAGTERGLETVVGENGVRLSGGQRQRIGIARALYADAEVLVFDEATSSLDSVTEGEVSRAIRDLHGRKTILIVAHRLATIGYADNIFFMADGEIVNSGPFRALYDSERTFREMADSQAFQAGKDVPHHS